MKGWDWGRGGYGASYRDIVCVCVVCRCVFADSRQWDKPSWDTSSVLHGAWEALLSGFPNVYHGCVSLSLSPAGPLWSNRSPAVISSWWWWTTSVTAACWSPLPWTPSRSCISFTDQSKGLTHAWLHRSSASFKWYQPVLNLTCTFAALVISHPFKVLSTHPPTVFEP